MAIELGGRTYRTLNDVLRVQGRVVKKCHVNGKLVYPDEEYERIPKGRYVLRLSGGGGSIWRSREIVKGRSGGIIGRDSFEYQEFTNSNQGWVECTVISQTPIAVWEGQFRISQPDGPTTHGADPVEATVGFAFTGEAYRDDEEEEAAYCGCHHHVASSVNGFNTGLPRTFGRNMIDWYYPIDGLTETVWFTQMAGIYGRDFHGEGSWTSYDAGRYGYPLTVKSVHRTPLDQDGRSNHAGTNDFCCGFTMSGSVPYKAHPLWAPVSEVNVSLPIAVCPFTSIDYNNNPPITSPTFLTDPPTDEATDDDKWPPAGA